MALMFVLTLAVIIALVGSVPVWPHSKSWGYFPLGAISVVLLVILILLLSGRVHVH
jgi:Protein of unknown function (DUF3309)